MDDNGQLPVGVLVLGASGYVAGELLRWIAGPSRHAAGRRRLGEPRGTPDRGVLPQPRGQLSGGDLRRTGRPARNACRRGRGTLRPRRVLRRSPQGVGAAGGRAPRRRRGGRLRSAGGGPVGRLPPLRPGPLPGDLRDPPPGAGPPRRVHLRSSRNWRGTTPAADPGGSRTQAVSPPRSRSPRRRSGTPARGARTPGLRRHRQHRIGRDAQGDDPPSAPAREPLRLQAAPAPARPRDGRPAGGAGGAPGAGPLRSALRAVRAGHPRHRLREEPVAAERRGPRRGVPRLLRRGAAGPRRLRAAAQGDRRLGDHRRGGHHRRRDRRRFRRARQPREGRRERWRPVDEPPARLPRDRGTHGPDALPGCSRRCPQSPRRCSPSTPSSPSRWSPGKASC